MIPDLRILAAREDRPACAWATAELPVHRLDPEWVERRIRRRLDLDRFAADWRRGLGKRQDGR